MLTALLVTSAATLFESVPFILAAAVFTQMPLRWNARIVAYLGCGCGVGPSARSLPAAAATCLVFGPLVAGARLVAAYSIDRFRDRARTCDHDRNADSMLSELWLVAPIALLGAGAALVLPAVAPAHPPAALAFFGGAAAAFVMAPCALGTAGFAATLRTMAPAAAAGFLCVAGLLDARTWIRRHATPGAHDALAYALLALACAIVAAHGGTGLVHPKFAPALWPCALAGAYLAYRHRSQRCGLLRAAPAVMLLGAFLGAPLPEYHATETTLAGAFAGERVDFTGVLTRTQGAATLVRYAITCCRADAAPIVLRLESTPPLRAGQWVRARGALIARENDLRLRPDVFEPVSPPPDPFVYR